MSILAPGMLMGLLAVSGASSRHVVDVMVLLGVVLVAVLLGTIGIVWARRRLMDADAANAGAGLTLHDLRQLHAQGQLNDAEYEASRAAILGAHAPRAAAPAKGAARSAASAAPVSGGPRAPAPPMPPNGPDAPASQDAGDAPESPPRDPGR